MQSAVNLKSVEVKAKVRLHLANLGAWRPKMPSRARPHASDFWPAQPTASNDHTIDDSSFSQRQLCIALRELTTLRSVCPFDSSLLDCTTTNPTVLYQAHKTPPNLKSNISTQTSRDSQSWVSLATPATSGRPLEPSVPHTARRGTNHSLNYKTGTKD
jgi:hypothetical protein